MALKSKSKKQTKLKKISQTQKTTKKKSVALKKTLQSKSQKPKTKINSPETKSSIKKTKVTASIKAKSPKKAKSSPLKTVKEKTSPTPVVRNKKVANKVESIPTKKNTKSALYQFITPLDDRLALSLKKIELRTPGGLFIPATATLTEGLKQGEVIAVGSGHKDKKGKIRPMDVKIGDQVLYSNYAGSTITFMEQEIIILRESDILGVVS